MRISFCKNVQCPASLDLLAYQKGETSKKEKAEIQKHLETCEFCGAEVELYEHAPQADEIVTQAEIPVPLFQLAEALLGNRQTKHYLLNKLLNEDGVTVNKA